MDESGCESDDSEVHVTTGWEDLVYIGHIDDSCKSKENCSCSFSDFCFMREWLPSQGLFVKNWVWGPWKGANHSFCLSEVIWLSIKQIWL